MSLNRRQFIAGALGGLIPPALAGPVFAHDRVHEIAIRDFAFEPGHLRVRMGDHVRFTNHDIAPHTATANDDSWDSGTLETGDSIELTVTSEWTGDYYCAYHPQMKAMLVIVSR